MLYVAMVAVVAGHIWPLHLQGHGGKGIATSLGALLFYDFQLLAGFGIAFVAAATVLRRSVLPGLFAFCCLPVVSLWLEREPMKALGLSLFSGMVLLAHRRNLVQEIVRLIPHRKIDAEQEKTEI